MWWVGGASAGGFSAAVAGPRFFLNPRCIVLSSCIGAVSQAPLAVPSKPTQHVFLSTYFSALCCQPVCLRHRSPVLSLAACPHSGLSPGLLLPSASNVGCSSSAGGGGWCRFSSGSRSSSTATQPQRCRKRPCRLRCGTAGSSRQRDSACCTCSVDGGRQTGRGAGWRPRTEALQRVRVTHSHTLRCCWLPHASRPHTQVYVENVDVPPPG